MAERVDAESQLITRIHVSSNCSLTPKEGLLFYLSIVAISLIIAGICLWRGYWPVLPFTGLELLLLGLVLGISMRRGRYQEVIEISDDRVIIDKIGPASRERHEFPRVWARVELTRSRRSSHPSRLLVGSHGRRCELGGSLIESDRVSLGQRLAELIGATGTVPGDGDGHVASEI